jgi:large subunit ribosomal protein L3
MKYILGTKVGMVQLYEANGNAIACTVVHAEPNVVLENKKTGIKIGYKDVKENKVNKAHKGVFKKVNQDLKKYVRTFSGIEGSYNVGDKITVDTFTAGQYVDVQGTSKGHGFTGAIKR